MKAREFDLTNYDLESMIKELAVKDVDNKLSTISCSLVKPKATIAYSRIYTSDVLEFEELTKKQQAEVVAAVKEEYETKKAASKKEYESIRKQCDEVFYDDKQYLKLVPALEDLYYCQAHTALEDFKSKKEHSKAVTNSVYQARLMAYSTVACD